MKKPQLFTVNIEETKGTAVMFPIGKAKGGSVIMATCAHTLESLEGRFKMITTDSNGEPVSIEGNNYLLRPELAVDLAFVKVRSEGKIRVCRIVKNKILSGLELSHARNVLMRKEFPDQVFDISKQKVSLLNKKFIRDGNGMYREIFSNRILKPGLKISDLAKGLQMRSVPGVSGSPLWDNNGNVYGMVCGGNEEEGFLIYLSIKTILKYSKMMF